MKSIEDAITLPAIKRCPNCGTMSTDIRTWFKTDWLSVCVRRERRLKYSEETYCYKCKYTGPTEEFVYNPIEPKSKITSKVKRFKSDIKKTLNLS